MLCCVCVRQIREGLCAAAGARRSVTCIAMEEGATLVNVSRDLFMSFIAAKPRTLQIYLHKARYSTAKPAHLLFARLNDVSTHIWCSVKAFSLWYNRDDSCNFFDADRFTLSAGNGEALACGAFCAKRLFGAVP